MMLIRRSLITANLTLLSLLLPIVSFQSINSLLIEEASAQTTSYREMRKLEADRLSRMSSESRPRLIKPYPQREKLLRQALAIYREIGDRPNEITTLVRLANVDALRFRHSKAVEKLRLALQIAKLSGDRESGLSVFHSQFGIRDVFGYIRATDVSMYLILHDPLASQSIDFLESLYSSSSDMDASQCLMYGNIGYNYLKKKNYLEAIKAYQKGITKCNKLNISDDQKNDRKYHYLAYIGISQKLMGQENLAQSTLKEVLTFYKDVIFNFNDEKLSRLDNNNFNNVIVGSGRCRIFTKIVILEKSDKLLEKLKRSRCANVGLIADAYNFFGEYNLAITYYEQALEIALAQEKKRSEYWFDRLIYYKHIIARMHELLGNNSEALKEYSLSLKTWRRLAGGREIYYSSRGVGLLINIGNFYTKIGDKEKGLNFYNEANEILKLSSDILHGGGGFGDISILSDEDDLDKLLPSSSTDRKPEPVNQEIQ